MSFRMDEHMQRFVVFDEPGETFALIDWQVKHKDDLTDYADRLERGGYSATFGGRALSDLRFVEDLVSFYDQLEIGLNSYMNHTFRRNLFCKVPDRGF